MTVRDLMQKLNEFDPHLPVCLTDWNEGYREPSEEAATHVELFEGSYCNGVALVRGKFVAIGNLT